MSWVKTKIANNQVRLPKLPDQRKEKHSNIFPDNLYTLLMFGRKGSGKSVVISHVVKDTVSTFPLVEKPEKKKVGETNKSFLNFGIRTKGADVDKKGKSEKKYWRLLKVFLFTASLNSDPVIGELVDFLRANGVTVKAHHSTFGVGKRSGRGGRVNHIENLITSLQEHDEARANAIKYNEELEAKKEEHRKLGIPPTLHKEPMEVPEKFYHLVILDDLSGEVGAKNPAVAELLKIHRHFNTSMIISSQDTKDVEPTGRAQGDNTILFSKFKEERLETVWNETGLDMSLEELKRIWRDATSEKHSFLWIDVKNGRLFQNFTHEYIRR